RLKTAVSKPTPSARIRIAPAVNTGLLARLRAAYLRSWISPVMASPHSWRSASIGEIRAARPAGRLGPARNPSARSSEAGGEQRDGEVGEGIRRADAEEHPGKELRRRGGEREPDGDPRGGERDRLADEETQDVGPPRARIGGLEPRGDGREIGLGLLHRDVRLASSDDSEPVRAAVLRGFRSEDERRPCVVLTRGPEADAARHHSSH